MRPKTRYTAVGESAVAYQLFGSGPIDLLMVPQVSSNLDLQWEERHFESFLNRLGGFARVAAFDKRATGLSDPLPHGGVPALEERMDDMLAVMKSVGFRRAAIFGSGEGGPLSALFAATYPDRVSHLILFNTVARLMQTDDYPWGWVPQETPMDLALEHYGDFEGELAIRNTPSHWQDPVVTEWIGRWMRGGASPGVFRALQRAALDIDVRHVLQSIRAPTLVIARAMNKIVDPGNGRYLAQKIPGARFVETPGGDHYPWFGDSGSVLDEIQVFLTGTRPEEEHDRVLCTVLFTDIVGSTERAAELGDRGWRELLASHHDLVRKELDRFRGREIDTAGDGFLATFDGPARAVKCAWSVEDTVRGLGLSVRAGAHTGECELIGEKVAGIAVHIAARVASQAGPGEVLVSSTVRDLVAGSGIRFEDRGVHALKGVPDEWRLYAAER